MNRKLLLLIGATGAVILVLAIWVLATDPVVREQKLPGGSVMVLRGVTYGRTHRVAVGNLLQRSRLRPPRLTRSGWRGMTSPSS